MGRRRASRGALLPLSDEPVLAVDDTLSVVLRQLIRGS